MNKIKYRILRIKYYLNKSYKLYFNNSMNLLPANIAFFVIWSIVPIMLLWEVVYRFFEFMNFNVDNINNLLISNNIIPRLPELNFSASGIILLVLILNFASKPFNSIIHISNNIYGLVDQTNFIKVKLKSLVFSLIIMSSFVVLLIIPILGLQILQLVDAIIDAPNLISTLENLRWPTTLIYLLLTVFIIYYFAPSSHIKMKYFFPGTIITALGWVIVTYGYTIYLKIYANNDVIYDAIYGGFANIIGLLIWVYLLSNILVIGLVINSAYYMEKVDENIKSVE